MSRPFSWVIYYLNCVLYSSTRIPFARDSSACGRGNSLPLDILRIAGLFDQDVLRDALTMTKSRAVESYVQAAGCGVSGRPTQALLLRLESVQQLRGLGMENGSIEQEFTAALD